MVANALKRAPRGLFCASMRARHHPLTALLAAFALLLQAFVVQTHVHALPAHAPHAAIAHIEAGASGLHDGVHDAFACPICQAAATTGVSLLPGAVSLLSAHGLIAHQAQLHIPAAPAPISHAWRSRAPPHLL